MEKIDNRKRVTRRILKENLIVLLTKEPIKDITVKELCYESKINRSTFYAHYQDIYSVLKEIEDEMYDELNKTITEYLFKNKETIYYAIFSFFAKHNLMCKILLSTNSGSDFIKRALDLGNKKFMLIYKNFNKNIDEHILNYFYSYVSNGIIGLLKTWIDNNMRESVSEIAMLAEKIVVGGVKFIS